MRNPRLHQQEAARIFCLFLTGLLFTSLSFNATASGNKEAPLMAYEPLADNTDVYALRSPGNPNNLVLIANADGSLSTSGNWVQVNRLDMPLGGTPYRQVSKAGLPVIPEIVSYVDVYKDPRQNANGHGGGNIVRSACDAGEDLEVVSFTLVNAYNGADIRTLADGDTIDKNAIEGFSIRANVCTDHIGSVWFNLNGSILHKENMFPYYINGGTLTVPHAYNPEPGNYTLTGIPYSGRNGLGHVGIMESISYVVLGDSTGLTDQGSDVAVNSALSVYPNPTSGSFSVKLRDAIVGANLMLFDASGKLIRQLKLGQETSYNKVEIDLSQHAEGIYLLKLQSGKHSFTERVIKQ